MDKYGYNFLSLDFMMMSADNLVGLRCHREFYTGIIMIVYRIVMKNKSSE